MDPLESVERMAGHTVYSWHLVAKWMSERDDGPADLKSRLATQLMAIESSLGSLGHSALHAEFESTKVRLRSGSPTSRILSRRARDFAWSRAKCRVF